MKLFSVAALLAAVASAANALMVNTPTNVVECQPLLITWDPQGSAGPYILSIHPGDNPSSPALFTWEGLTGTSFTWVVTVPAGTSLGLALRDPTGNTVRSAPFPVLAGSTTGCSASSSVGPPVNSSSLPVSSSSFQTVISTPSPIPTPIPSLNSTTTPISTPISTSTRPPSASSSSSSVRPPTTSSPVPSPTRSTSGNTGGAFTNAVDFGYACFLAALVGAVLA